MGGGWSALRWRAENARPTELAGTKEDQAMSDEKNKQAHENWIKGIDPLLEVMSAVPLMLSTPVHLLAENRITDKKYLFVRN